MTTRKVSKRDASTELVITYARISAEDHAELRRREEKTGAPIAAQIRILVHEALRAGKKVIQ